MGGLIGALAVGALGGAGKGMTENAQADMKSAYDNINAQMKSEMEQRIYERGRRDKVTDDATAFDREKGLINARKDPNDAKLKKLQVQELEKKIADDAKVPAAVKMEFETLKKQNETIAASLYKAQAEGTYNPETAANAENAMANNTERMASLLKPYLGKDAPKGKGVDDLFPKKNNSGATAQW
jgi:hypothetical protein